MYIVQIEEANKPILPNEIINQKILMDYNSKFDLIEITEAKEMEEKKQKSLLHYMMKKIQILKGITENDGFYFTKELCINYNLNSYNNLKEFFWELTFDEYMKYNPNFNIDTTYAHLRNTPFHNIYVYSHSFGTHHLSFEQFLHRIYHYPDTNSVYQTKFKFIKMMECKFIHSIYGNLGI